MNDRDIDEYSELTFKNMGAESPINKQVSWNIQESQEIDNDNLENIILF